ncbi:LicD family protein [Limosilactobacillus sp. STM2_1]|uniref:LicD family protein n=1 Tax=Limosilactobacillus rudii TaxID=2759755 RepID=A0A7W3UJM9_9LACO|nr:LicD family protein [Limosilactobacillus rudii]MBB1080290.1 LicD family protein [Limosilactobacillus rudii]MBB1096806.1 LicD family protein [Limosilactobacillus rudii]MCD7133703.1 LicD family protein [Limosilactobacillus rudii]
MKEIDALQAKKIILDILIYFDEFCKKNNLHYTLAYGTLLGAARHHGFIPWDDDIDIEMPINDYKKLLELMDNVPLENRYQLHSLQTEEKFGEHYYYPFSKLEDSFTKAKYLKTNDQGSAFIDIFPMTPLPLNKKKWYLYNKKARFLKIMLAGIDGKNRSKIRNGISKIESKIFDYREIRNALWELAVKYVDNNHSDYLVDGTWHDYKNKNYFPKKWFESYTSLKFEGYDMSVITNYKKMLEHDYGNWNTLPPKEKRIPHHDYILYFKGEKDD